MSSPRRADERPQQNKSAPAAVPVVLFDFDGVLVRGDSYEHFVRVELGRSRYRRAMMLPVAMVAVPMLKIQRLRRPGARLMVRCAFLGWSTSRFQSKATQFGRQLANDVSLVVGEALETLRDHVSAGARVVVVTTSAYAVVRATLDEWELTTVELAASQPTCGPLGLRAAMRNHGGQKVRQLAAVGLHPPWAVTYSDSLSDLPMLHGARQPVLVNLDESLRAHAQQALGERASFVTWQ